MFLVKKVMSFFVIFNNPSKHTQKLPIKRDVYKEDALYDFDAISPTRRTVAGPDRIGKEWPNKICKKSDNETIKESF
jgi:hypothetical protein